MENANGRESDAVLKKNFKLFKDIFKFDATTSHKVDLSNIEKIINIDIKSALEKNAPPNFPELYFEFKKEYEKFCDFILYEDITGKNIVALGGGFSSGKSSFINSLLGKQILPSDINPSTSVPSYVVHGEEDKVYAVNIFDRKINLALDDIKLISHGFAESYNANNEIEEEEILLGHILKSITLKTKLQKYEKIAFLDTPGYSKLDMDSYSAQTDESIARIQLNSSNYIIWFIQADSGSITEDDIIFLNSLKKDIPKLFIINKADKVTKDNINMIIDKIKGMLDIKGIQYVDVVSYSRKRPNDYDYEKIDNYLQKWNKATYNSTFAHSFKVLFSKCKNYYESEIDKESKNLHLLNKAVTLSENESVVLDINKLINSSRKQISILNEMMDKVAEIQKKFLLELKFISDIIGVDMPEPTELELIDYTKMKTPLENLKIYLKRNGYRTESELLSDMKSLLVNIEPKININNGGIKYKKELLNLLKNTIPKEININNEVV